VLRRKFGSKRDEVRGEGRGETHIVRGLMICTLTQYCSGDKIEKNETGRARSAHGGEERLMQGFGWET
jgi:hypothetical protein